MVKEKVTHPTGINWSDVGMNYQSTRNRLDRTMSHLSKLLDQTVQAELEMKDRLLNNIAQFTAQVQKLSAEHDVASPESTRNRLDRTNSHLSKLLDQTVEAEPEMKDRLLNNIAQFTAQVQKLSAEHDVASPEVQDSLTVIEKENTITKRLELLKKSRSAASVSGRG
ncbi:hypothetical protein HPB50_028162 [Hyalomma asiaticum]|nr:hypothetical protein HPB50_028162 [Hyalomma asiaticum]